MNILNIIKSNLARYREDTKGNFTIMAGVMMSSLIVGTGAAYDYSQASKAKSYAQLAADNMALAASVAVDSENADRYIEGHEYAFSEIGGPSNDFTGTIKGVVEYDILDQDGESLIARATVIGTYKPAFASIVGINEVEFKAVSDVAYAAREGEAASIFFVADNSGSMNSYDNSGYRKINSLESSMRDFMDILEILDTDGTDDTFRTALFPYSSSLITSKIANPEWGIISDYNINRMSAGGGTRSTSALARASSEFEDENSIHEETNGEDEPLKFLVFMSDGANNGSYTQEQCEPGATPEYWVDTYRGWNTIYYSQRGWFDHWVVYHPAVGNCETVTISPVNTASLVQCTAMKNDGVKIYSIAYDVSENERAVAEQFMRDCSSGDAYYQYAEDGTDLDAVFDQIGEAIVKEVVRLKR